MINLISFKNYKLFKEKQTLELRPITILIGKNNSGKSAVAKLPALISGSLSGKFNAPLKWENEGVRLGLSYEDLVYDKYVAAGLEFEISAESENLKIIISGDRNNKVNILKYYFNDAEIDVKKNIFKGFTYEKQVFNTLTLNYDYIGPFRNLPSPNFTYNSDEFDKIGIEGENAYQLLIQLSENKDSLFASISNWYKENFEGWGLKVSQIAGITQTYEIAIEKKGLKAVNIINGGQGLNQALPLVVRSFIKNKEPTLIIIEEPETHLHPAAHGNLAQRFAESYIEDTNKKYLIETHSQNFVLRMRRLVAEGKLSKDNLAIYYVDFDEDENQSLVKLIEVDEDGGIPNNDWPDGIFNETSKETRAIYNAQINNLKHVDRD